MEEDKKDIIPDEPAAAASSIDTTPRPTADSIPDDVEEAATAEDLEAFMRDRRKARMEKQREEKPNPEVEEYMSEENQIDPYLEPDPDIPWPKYEENVFLARGCRSKPRRHETYDLLYCVLHFCLLPFIFLRLLYHRAPFPAPHIR